MAGTTGYDTQELVDYGEPFFLDLALYDQFEVQLKSIYGKEAIQDNGEGVSLFDENGKRLYLTDTERKLFLDASRHETRENRVFCSVLHYTGCRLSEALELTPIKVWIMEKLKEAV